jgi:hypothetical protein
VTPRSERLVALGWVCASIFALKGRKDENINGLILRRFPRFIFASNDLGGFY